MEPTEEQLIRDYLNRLSVAARSRLDSDDRRAFLARTREFLESRSSASGAAEPGDVLDALSSLGQPAAAVENEYARLAAERDSRAAARSGLWRPRDSAASELPGSTPDANAGPDSDGLADPPPPPGSASGPRAAVDVSHLAGRELKGDIEKKVKVNRPLTSRWRPGAPLKQRPSRPVPRPRAGGSQPRDGNGVVPAGSGTGSRRPGPQVPDPQVPDSQVPDSQVPDSQVPGSQVPGPTLGTPAAGSPGNLLPREGPPGGTGQPGGGQPGSTSPDAAAPGSTSPEFDPAGSVSPTASSPEGASPAPRPGTPGGAERPAAGGPASAARPARAITTRQLRIQRPQLSVVGRGLAREAARFSREHRLETAAVVLMVLCGLVYPFPIWLLGFSFWLLGAIFAAASSQWSLWDKWAGLLGPVVLVIAGTSAGLALGGQRHGLAAYTHEVLADSRYMIKLAAVLGAVYLAWRAQRGRRFPLPPWNRPHRI